MKPPRNFLKPRPLLWLINLTDALFGTPVALERDENLANLMSYKRNSFSDFAIDELCLQEEREVL